MTFKHLAGSFLRKHLSAAESGREFIDMKTPNAMDRSTNADGRLEVG